MLNNTNKIKEIYKKIQEKVFYAIPVKSEEIYLYASIIDKLGKVQVGEMYFYFMPKGILKRKFVNVYEVPVKYDIEEDEYMKIINSIYDDIIQLREEFANNKEKIWSNITITIKNDEFKIEYNFNNILGSQEEYYNHHIYWRYKYLHIEPQGKKEKQAYNDYLTKLTSDKNHSKIKSI